MKIKTLVISMLCCISTLAFADKTIKPIVHGKTYDSFIIPKKELTKPLQVIKGEANECTGSVSNEFKYPDYSVLSSGLIREVKFTGNNAVIFHGKKVDANMTKTNFLKLFKNKLLPDSGSKNQFVAQSEEDELVAIVFYFKNDKIDKYEISINDC